MSCRVKIRRQFKAALQQESRIIELPHLDADIRKHTDGGNIDGIFFQQFTNDPLGLTQFAVTQQFDRIDKFRMLSR